MSSTSSTTSFSFVAAPSRFAPRPATGTGLAATAKSGPTLIGIRPPTFSSTSLSSLTTPSSPPTPSPAPSTKCPLSKISISPRKRALHRNIDGEYDEILNGIRMGASTRIAGSRGVMSTKENASNIQKTNREAELLAKLEAAEKRYQALRDGLDSQALCIAGAQDKLTNAHSDPDHAIGKRPRTRYEDDKEENVIQGRKGKKREGAGEAENTYTNEDTLEIQAFFGCVERCQKVSQTQGEEAQHWLDLMQALLDNIPGLPEQSRSIIFNVMLGLSKSSGLYPKCLTLKNVDKLGERPVAGGGFGDVWKGRVADQPVCLKVVRVFTKSDVGQLVKEYMREAIVWQQLRHPNLLPFLGIYHLSENELCLVSPWMERGNLVTYLQNTPREEVDHLSLASDVASGLAHLHDRKIVHGDIKGLNVLITPELRASIGDFGLSHVADSQELKLAISLTSHSRGTTRWQAPELMDPELSYVSTAQSDMFAYGCVCYEIFSAGLAPFYDLKDVAVVLAVFVHRRQPSRPAGLDDDIWEFMTSYWNRDPSLRPTATDTLARIRVLRGPSREGSDMQSTPRWSSVVEKIRSSVHHPSLDLDLLNSFLNDELDSATG
ncbi:Rho guanine nucleotide exchange factor [Marasmius tenuissimus]|nr:Rho guanine nucleotide exchange factor [Marasmius tenuissimus]